MSLSEQIAADMKAAMKNKDKKALAAIRAVKSELLLAKTKDGGDGELSDEDGLKMLAKLVKQRKESAAVYKEQGREDLAENELFEAGIIEKYLPAQLSEEELAVEIKKIIEQVGATSPKDMGKVMSVASKAFTGRAEGKTVSNVVKNLLNNM